MKQAIIFLLFPLFAAAQTQNLSFGAQIDSAGQVYIIQQVVTTVGDTTTTKAEAVKFQTAEAAIPTVNLLRESLSRDSAVIQNMFLNNARQRQQIDAVLQELNRRKENPGGKSETHEQEIVRLREENKRLKGGG